MQSISNDVLQVTISAKGAELQNIQHLENGLEYLWNGDANFWGKKSPVLFPIVGGLKNGEYKHNGKTYKLGRHGFAREMEFEVTNSTNQSVEYTLTSNEQTLAVYPFEFDFKIIYSLKENILTCTYIVTNSGNDNMYFSCGAHPAFAVPLTNNTTFEDWFLEFSSIENVGKWPLSNDGLILQQPIDCLNNTNQLPLSKSLFYKDALVFKNLSSNKISIVSTKSPHGLTMQFNDFPYYGIWSAKDANFVCLEPWCGIADNTETTGLLEQKEGIIKLTPKDIWQKNWQITLF
jgi:galactose mutarotase-like enzyme